MYHSGTKSVKVPDVHAISCFWTYKQWRPCTGESDKASAEKELAVTGTLKPHHFPGGGGGGGEMDGTNQLLTHPRVLGKARRRAATRPRRS